MASLIFLILVFNNLVIFVAKVIIFYVSQKIFILF